VNVDIKRALRNVQETGAISMGTKETIKALKKNKVKLVIVSRNCPPGELTTFKSYKVPVYTYDGSNTELWAACGKPFSIAALAIIDGGKSDILALKGE
jgi:large subunit ribosomal protein L30e